MSFICGLILCLLLGRAAQSQLGEVETVTPSPPDSAGDNSLQLKHSVNGTAYLLCPIRSIEVPEVVWTKDGAALPADPKFAISEKVTDLDSSLIRNAILRIFGIKRIIFSLKIVRLEIEDSGIYTCALSNSTQKNSFNLTITANDPTKLSTNTKNIQRISCQIKTEHPVSFQWLKDGSPLPEDPRYDIKELRDEVPSVLNQIGINVFVSASLLSINGIELGDAGNYSCVDRSLKNYYSKLDFILEVEEGEKRRLELAIGGRASFFCQFRMRFLPIAEWTKDGVPLPEDSRIRVINQQIKHEEFASKDPIVHLLPNKKLNSILTIYNIQPEDAGTYKCRLANTPSLNLHQSWILIVNGTRTQPISQDPKLV